MDSESTNDGLHEEVKTVTIRLYGNHEAAALAAANLKAHGFDCWVSADDCGGMYPSLTVAGGVRLHVRASDAEAATALLDSPVTGGENYKEEVEDVLNLPTQNAAPRKLAIGQIFAGLIIGFILALIVSSQPKNGKQIQYHYAHSGKVDGEWIYQDGHLAEYQEDRNQDGKWDVWVHYDETGERQRTEEDNNFDGKPDAFWTYSNGDLVSIERDTDFNGIPDEITTYKNHILQQVDMKPNGTSYSTKRYKFKNGVLTEEWRGGDSTGKFKEIVLYDPFGNPISTNANKFQIYISP
ncbi:MAG TPA: hypothetical protein VIK53_17220 [Verrucomicrobiae bacterium]